MKRYVIIFFSIIFILFIIYIIIRIQIIINKLHYYHLIMKYAIIIISFYLHIIN